MTEHGIIFLAFLILYILLMIINYRAHTEYPERLTEGALGTSILDSKGPAWFVMVKMGMAFVIIRFVFIPFSMILPTRYSYLLWGILLGSVFFNLLHDYVIFKKAKSATLSPS
jgi:magnesium-transporting ATPase (P-type)